MNAPLIFFDIDDTLLDHKGAEQAAARSFFKFHSRDLDLTADEFVNAWRRAADKHFHRYQLGKITFQDQRRARLRDLFPPLYELTDKKADDLFESYLKAYQENWCLFPDVQEALNGLAGYSLGIISNGDSRQQRDKLESTGIASYFSVVLISGDIGIAKPDSEIFLHACRQANLPPNQCCYIGDSLETDVIPATQAGLHGIWLNRQSETKPIPIPEVSSLSGLRTYLEMQNRDRPVQP